MVPRGLGAAARRALLPIVAFGFVILALVALAITPTVMVRRLASAVEENNTTFVPARRLVGELRFLFEEQVAEIRALILTGEQRYLEGFREARRAGDETLVRLSPLVHPIGPTAVANLDAVRRYSARWHVLDDALASGRITHEQYRTRLPTQTALYDSTLAATIGLEEEIDRIASARGREIGSEVVSLRTVSLVFGLLALLSAIVVGWFGWQQYALSRELARVVDEETRLRTESEQRREEIERITESRARLMRGFTHDVKNPLGAADGFLQLLESGLMDGLTEKQKSSLTRARRAIGAALHLIDELLELARAEAGAIVIAWAATDVRDAAREAAEEYRAQAEAKGLSMTTEIPDELPLVESDAARIRQILGNLISNAVKYTRQGGVTVGVEARAGEIAPGPGPWVAVEVSDTGPGIPEAQQQLLFQEFRRLGATAGEKGAGIGLTISERIARALGGEITVASELGRGSTFTLWLPLARRPTAPREPS
jgi:signal transduction histidine kinase